MHVSTQTVIVASADAVVADSFYTPVQASEHEQHVIIGPCCSQQCSVAPLSPAALDPGAQVLDVGAKAGASACCQRHEQHSVQPLALPCRVEPAAPGVVQVRL